MGSIIGFIGIPGSGKSTQIEILKAKLSGKTVLASIPAMVKNKRGFHKFLTQADIIKLNQFHYKTDASREKGELAPIELDELLFEVCLKRIFNEKTNIILDGMPRGIKQAEIFWEMAQSSHKSNFFLAHLVFPENQAANSFHRQYLRAVENKGLLQAYSELDKFRTKIKVYEGDTMAACRFLQDKAIGYFEVDCSDTKTQVAKNIFENFSRLQKQTSVS